jgi:hypothetical protein
VYQLGETHTGFDWQTIRKVLLDFLRDFMMERTMISQGITEGSQGKERTTRLTVLRAGAVHLGR